ncbi:MAG: DUF1566 domain-containing protein [Bacteroidota bacterium]
MKKLLLFISIVLFSIQIFAQAPSGISYQAVIRDADAELLVNSEVSIRVAVIFGSEDGTTVFEDDFVANTNQNGLVSFIIEEASLSEIDWRNGPYYFKLEVDPEGGTDYSVASVDKIFTVPYAFHSNTAGYAYQALEFDPVFTNHLAYNISDLGSGVIISTAERNKLSGIEEEAEVNIQSDWEQTDDQLADFIKNKPDLSDLHIHTNYDVLDNITSAGSGEIITIDERNGLHLHSNHDVLDNIINEGSGEIITELERDGLHQHANHDILDNISSTGSGDIITDVERSNIHIHANHDVLDAVSDAGSGNIISSEERDKLNSIKTYEVGDFAHGGIVFWVDETGQHGLVVAKDDQSDGIRWYAGTDIDVMATGSGTYAGFMNTIIILAEQGSGDGDMYAAKLCSEVVIEENGFEYADWYLPSLNELLLLQSLQDLINNVAMDNGGSSFATVGGTIYWSSNQSDGYPNYAKSVVFSTGGTGSNFKDSELRVRAIRKF